MGDHDIFGNFQLPGAGQLALIPSNAQSSRYPTYQHVDGPVQSGAGGGVNLPDKLRRQYARLLRALENHPGYQTYRAKQDDDATVKKPKGDAVWPHDQERVFLLGI